MSENIEVTGKELCPKIQDAVRKQLCEEVFARIATAAAMTEIRGLISGPSADVQKDLDEIHREYERAVITYTK